ncbi:taste receptor type 1 member 3 [Pangasianodon hypophthalmus]|uniref:taste receptor type 1 member 3 n=1 Tax=Pangasianodon hypophthalmus TaxID=310915 RepID=UPI002307975D|nr:taste receptor type 1 member 3 [Pangasianodon hypophthalmus]
MAGQAKLLILCCLLSSALGANPLWFQNISTNLFRSPGDILLGGLFPINQLTSNLTKRVEPDDIHCKRVDQYGLALALVMKYTIDEINATPNLLPNVKLGFENYDDCGQSAIIMKPTLRFFTTAISDEVDVMCNYTEYMTRVHAVIGPYSSEMAAVIGQLVSFFLMPQVSYRATSDGFSDKLTYPSFMRTAPSDSWQAMAMVQLLQEFGWNWVAVIGSDETYGKQGQQQVSQNAASGGICVAYEGLIPVYEDPVPMILEILDGIVEAKVGVVVVFASSTASTAFFKEVIRRNMTGVWLASTAWAVYSSIVTLPGIQTIGTVLGFTDMTQPIDLLSPYVKELFKKMEQERVQMQITLPDPDVSPLENPCPGCWNLSPANVSIVETELVRRTAFSVYSAVYSVAQALHDMLGCDITGCARHPKTENIYPWQLLPWVRKVSLSLNGTQISFDTEGNPSIGYDLLAWVFQNNTMSFKNIGTFVRNLTVDKKQIKWHTTNNTVPTSRCSSDCLSGQVRIVKGFYSCCFDCSDCLEGTYQNRTDDIQCTKCPPRQWSKFRSTSCVFPTYEYLAWSSFESVALILAGLLLLSCQAAMGILFFQHRGTPLLKALGGPLCGLGLMSLMGSCISLVLYLGQPNDGICRIQILLYVMFPTVALSTILAISMQIVYVCEFPEKAPEKMESLQGLGSWSLVLACCGVQSGFVGWFIIEGPSLTKWVDSLEVNFVTRFLPCPVEPILNFGLMLGFNGLLALICFMCTFMAPKPVRQYNFARDITIASLIYCVIWVIFIPIYAGLGDKDKTIAQVVFTLISNTALTVAYYLPKCHLLVKEPDLNKNEYFASILEGIPPIPPEEPPQDKNKQDNKKDNKEDNKEEDKIEDKEESKEESKEENKEDNN